eukprot:CAMPEP_0118925346 /NCGR_PEP_ID=MMETSP1169-20130426/3234_1 /TAXON_ID=36882 /ORGANISM="Pyramimonas obovata, Strain CCMP722" /LENGTH=159 /DNA_ID=CAMNT_0006866603 /DNA_START=318 /DNA_END=797 /DNA_ORIENTATION=+
MNQHLRSRLLFNAPLNELDALLEVLEGGLIGVQCWEPQLLDARCLVPRLGSAVFYAHVDYATDVCLPHLGQVGAERHGAHADVVVNDTEEVASAVVEEAPPQRIRRKNDRQQRRVHQEPNQKVPVPTGSGDVLPQEDGENAYVRKHRPSRQREIPEAEH